MKPRRTLPAPPPGAFVGREREVEGVERALAAGERLVCVHGAAGVGKTRLALELAARRRARAGAGATWFCDSSSATNLAELCAAVARALEAPLRPSADEAAVESVGDVLAERGDVLLAVDNVEQIATAAAYAIARWLGLAPDARFLVTSRDRLRVRGEWTLELEPLAQPPEGEVDAGSVGTCDATRLFVARARAARTDFALSDANAADVAAIVRRLDGIPLAIELCAAHASVLSPAQMNERLARGTAWLGAAGARDADARHATLRSAVEWSWSLLDEPDRDALAECSVFRGGWSLDAAERVLSVGDVLRALQRLHDASLVRTYAADVGSARDERRFALFEVVREIAGERLDAAGRAGATRARHAATFVDACESWAALFDRRDGDGARRCLAIERDNLAAAVEAEIAAGRWHGALRGLLALEPLALASARQPVEPFARMLDAAIAGAGAVDGAAPDATVNGLAPLVARAWVARARAEIVLGRVTGSIALYERARDAARAGGARATEALALSKLASVRAFSGDHDAASTLFAEARAALAGLDDPALAAIVELDNGDARAWAGDRDDAAAHYRLAVAGFRAAGDAFREGVTLANLAHALIDSGAIDEARAAASLAVEACNAVDNRRSAAFASGELGRALHAAGLFDDALSALEDALRHDRATGQRLYQASHLRAVGDVELERGRLPEALAAYDRAAALLTPIHDAQPAPAIVMQLAALLGARAVADAFSARIDDAAARIARAQQLALALSPSPEASVVSLCSATVALARARSGGVAGGTTEAALAAARACLDATADDARASEDVRYARRTLERTVAAAALERPSRRAVSPFVVGPQASWFQPPDGATRVDLGRRHVLRRILALLVDQRLRFAGRGVTREELVAAGWRGERMAHGAAVNRLNVALSELRALGLRDVLRTSDDGVLLDPGIDVLEGEPD